MSENYIVINGKKIELTEEQLKQLGIETKPNPFGRTNDPCGEYFYTNAFGSVSVGSEEYSCAWKNLRNAANYFNDKQFANQVALHQMLYRKLLKFAYDNGIEDTSEWDGCNQHWAIRYNGTLNKFIAHYQRGYKAQGVYFSSEKGVEQAIAEVVEPFMKEHPEFVW